MKKKIAVITVLAAMFSFTAVNAATTASVSATVTVQNVSLTVSDGTIIYGTLGVGASQSTLATGG